MADPAKPGVDLRQLFGLRLAIIRKLRGFSQEGLAAESGLKRSHISSIERGKINITLNNIDKLAQTFKTTPKELLDFYSETVRELNFVKGLEGTRPEVGSLFGQRLVIVRKLLGFTQDRLSAESKLGRSHLSRIERGKMNITLNTIGLIAQTLSVEPKELMDFDSDTLDELKGNESSEHPGGNRK